jgi:hypothetical protein
MTRDEAAVALRDLVRAVGDRDETAAAARLLERVAVREDAQELRSALCEMGARSALRILRRTR